MNEVDKQDLLLVSSLKLRIKHFAGAGTNWSYYLKYDNVVYYLKSWIRMNCLLCEKEYKKCVLQSFLPIKVNTFLLSHYVSKWLDILAA